MKCFGREGTEEEKNDWSSSFSIHSIALYLLKLKSTLQLEFREEWRRRCGGEGEQEQKCNILFPSNIIYLITTEPSRARGAKSRFPFFSNYVRSFCPFFSKLNRPSANIMRDLVEQLRSCSEIMRFPAIALYGRSEAHLRRSSRRPVFACKTEENFCFINKGKTLKNNMKKSCRAWLREWCQGDVSFQPDKQL